jgi:hypothetical protein
MTELTQELLKELLSYDPDTGIFTNLTQRGKVKKGAVAGSKYSNGYIYIEVDYKRYRAHRLAWLYVYGEFPANQIDHINEIKDDNKIVNLRLATNLENQHNVSSLQLNNTSGFRGVFWRKNRKKWKAIIYLNGRQKHIGHFDTAEEASEAYLAAKKELHPFWEEKTIRGL